MRKNNNTLDAAWLESPLGPVLAIANESALVLLEFNERRGLDNNIVRLKQVTGAEIVSGRNSVIAAVEQALAQYFQSGQHRFTIPMTCMGTPFQQKVWQALMQIPPGETRSYADIAKAIGQPTACRAVARANGANQLALIIPCHRVINSNGELGGYAGGISRKAWLLEHEQVD